MTRDKADTPLRRFASAREITFMIGGGFTPGGSKKIKDVNVASKDAARPEVIKLLRNETPLWPPPSACNMGMTMWMQLRTWYPINERN